MGLFRRILREPVFSGNPVLKKNTRKGPSQALSVLLRDVWQAHDFSQHC